MATPEIFQLASTPITAHAFNADRSEVAISPNSTQVHVYSRAGDSWTLAHVLDEHDKMVTSIDWASSSNRIVTCAQDRNAYVWTFDKSSSTWKPTLVLLRIDRAATFVRWSPNEDKFAVASGAKCVCICSFEEESNWWVSKHLKKPIHSTILSLDWHPNNILLACGSADNKACVLSAYIKGLDVKPPANPWGDKLPFNTVCADLSSNGWVHSIAFSPSGDALAWSAHDSTLTVHQPANGTTSVVRTTFLPFSSILWLDETNIIVTGHDCTPILFTSEGGQWRLAGRIDEAKKATTASASTAFDKFRAMDSRGAAAGTVTDLNTIHQNVITCIRGYDSTREHRKFTTTAGDGKLVLWTTLNEAMSKLRIR